jgi:hypothetical protein
LSAFSKTLSIREITAGISLGIIPLLLIAAEPIRMPEVTKGDLSSKGTIFLLVVISALINAFSAAFPLMPLFLRSISIMWLSVPSLIIL